MLLRLPTINAAWKKWNMEKSGGISAAGSGLTGLLVTNVGF
jgi:hypothetical protein